MNINGILGNCETCSFLNSLYRINISTKARSRYTSLATVRKAPKYVA